MFRFRGAPVLGLLFVLLALIVALTVSSSVLRADLESQSSYKVIAATGELAPDGRQISLWHDYGAFALYRVAATAVDQLPDALQADIVANNDAMATLLIDAYPLQTQTDVATGAPNSLQYSNVPDASLHLVQFVGPIKDEWLQAIANTGAQPIQYIANNGYLVWATSRQRQQLDQLVADGHFLQYSGLYEPYFKLGPTLSRQMADADTADSLLDVTIQMVRHDGQRATENLVRELAVSTTADWSPILNYQNAVVTVRASDLSRLAFQPDIYWIGERFERHLMDEVQNQIIAGHVSGGGPSGTGYLPWLQGLGFSTNPADYPVVDVVDDGIGNGTVNATDPGLHELGQLTNPTRLQYIANCTTAVDGAGPDGHGHINVSIVGGYDTRSGFPFQDPNGYQRGLGVSPFTRVAGTRIFGPNFNLTNCGGSDSGLIRSIQDNGATISSNSWGCSSCAGSYDDSAQAFDVGTRDADLTEAGNQELTFIFSAGNAGPGAATVGSPGNGKNMITVGASENVRPDDEDGFWTDGCAIGPSGADDWRDIIDFSSRGPSPGGRVKPEIIAPGTHIQGSASTNSSYNGSGVCDQYRPGGQTTFAASSGTSHSAPAVSGVASLVTYWLENNYGLTPSPAMMKSYLVAHPTYLTGVSANDSLPSNNQGYGMPNLELAFDETPRTLLDQSHVFDNSGETWTWSGAVADSGQPVRIVLAYTDAAGAIGTSPQVNNLNLTADIGSSSYVGNVFSGEWSVTGGSADTLNNYEAIFLPSGTSGAIDITITAFNIAGDGIPNSGDGTDQDFALVCYNCAQNPDFTISATPESLAVCAPTDAVFDVSVGQILGYTDPVTLSATGQPAGTTLGFSTNPVVPAGNSTMTIGNTGAAASGSYPLVLSGSSSSGTHEANMTLDLFAGIPGIAGLQIPGDGALDSAVETMFGWTAVADTDAYLLEVATDAGFGNIVYSALEAGNGHTLPPGSALAFATQYFWRVTAQNPCGSGSTSTTFNFTTQSQPALFCSTPNLTIPDSGTVVDTLNVAGVGTITDLDVSLDAGHSWVGDLSFTLEHNGLPVAFFDRPGVPASTYGCSGNDIVATLDDEAALPLEIECGASTPSINGIFSPNAALSAFDGQDVNGVWTLTVTDAVNPDGGNLAEWCLIPSLTGGTATPTHTPAPPTETPTATPTNTPAPPTNTPTATNTPAAPTATATNTPVPPTATSTPLPPTATNTPLPTNTPEPGSQILYVSSDSDGSVDGVTFEDEDILAYDTDMGSWSLLFDGSDVGLGASGNQDVDAFHLMDDSSILLSILGPSTLPDVGTVDDSDVIRFVPTALGATTTGSFELYIDASDIGLSLNPHDVDAISLTNAGDLVLSVLGGYDLGNGLIGSDEDMLRFDANTLGDDTSGTLSQYFDGSDVGLADGTNEDVWGISLDAASGDIYLSTRGTFSVTGVAGDGADIFACEPTSLGGTTACTFSALADGSTIGLSGERVDGIHVVLNAAPPATATPTNTPGPTSIATNTPTNTPIPPTPTDTPVPTDTPIPPTPTETPVATDTPMPPTPTDTPVPGGPETIYVSSSSDGAAGTVNFADEDILAFAAAGGTWSLYFDGSDVGLTQASADIDAFHLLSDNSILLSFIDSPSIPDVGSVDDSDIVRFVPTSLGETTAGTFELYFDGSDVGLDNNAEDIDAIMVLVNGDMLLSTQGGNDVLGFHSDEDLLLFTPNSLGETTTGSWSEYFDGSDVGLTISTEDIWGAWVNEATGAIYLTTQGTFTVDGVSGDGDDVVTCAPITLGTDTACTFGLFWDGSANAFSGETMDGLFILQP